MRLNTLLLFMLIVSSGFPQNQRVIDSLTQKLNIVKEDTLKVQLLSELGFLNRTIAPIKGIEYCNEALKLSKKINYKKGEAGSYFTLGTIYQFTRNDSNAIVNLLQALTIYEGIKYYRGAARAYNNLGIIFGQQKNFTKAIECYENSITLKEKLHDKAGIASTLNNIGSIYGEQNSYTLAIEKITASLKLEREIGNVLGVAQSYHSLAILEDKFGHKIKAEQYFNTSLLLYDSIGYFADKAKCYEGLANHALKYKEFEKAINYANNALEIIKPLNATFDLMSIYERLENAYTGLGDYKNAYKNIALGRKLADEIYSKELGRQSEDILVKYQTEKKEQENKLLKAENENKELKLNRNNYLLLILIGFIFVLLLAGFFIAKQNKLKSEQKSMQLEQKLLRSQMNPHFIFNSLNSIHSVVLSGDKSKAAKYLASFSKLIRSILESSRFELITLEKEISLLENYIKLQALRFENEINYTVDIDPDLDLINTLVPPMLTQPFLENAIEHGFFGSTHQAELKLSFRKEDEFLKVSVTDNGKGISESKTSEQHISLATGITKERLLLLNKKQTKKTTFNITEAFPLNKEFKGVMVSFSIPLELG